MKYRTEVMKRQTDQIRVFHFAELFVIFYAIPALSVSLLRGIPSGAMWLSNHGRFFLLLYLTITLVLTISNTLYRFILTLILPDAQPCRSPRVLNSRSRPHARSKLVLLNLNQ